MSEQLPLGLESSTGLPSGWEKVELREIAEVRLGRQRSPKRALGPNMRPYMRAANVTWAGISLHDVKEMDFSDREFETYRLKPFDILLSEASGSASEVGKPAIWRDQLPGSCFQNTLIRVRSRMPELVTYLQWHFMRDARTMRFARASRGTGIHHLGSKTLDRWEVVLPPLAEQRRIVAEIEKHFSRLDDAVATLKRVQAKLERARASVLKAAVEGRLVPTEAELARAEGRSYEPASQLLERILAERERKHAEAQAGAKRKKKYKPPVEPDVEGLPQLPEGWVWATVDQVSWAIRYGTSAKCSEADLGVPVLRMGNIKDGSITYNNLKYLSPDHSDFPDQYLHSEELLFNRTNSPELVGKSAVFLGHTRPVACASYLIRVSPVPGSSTRYLACAINSPRGRVWIRSVVTQQVGQANVNGTKLRNHVFPLPPQEEQQRIMAEVDRLLSEIDSTATAVERNLKRCERLHQSILKRAFEGKLVPQDPTDEPASELLARIQAQTA